MTISRDIDDWHNGTLATAALLTGAAEVDHMLPECPRCNKHELRAEAITQWLPVGEITARFGPSRAELIAGGVRIDAFGRAHCAVPWVTCMACGFTSDASIDRLPDPAGTTALAADEDDADGD